MKLMMHGKVQEIDYKNIAKIKNGKATIITGRTYDIVCDCLSINDYEIIPDNDAPNGNGYIVCEICNKVHYLKDLKDQQENN